MSLDADEVHRPEPSVAARSLSRRLGDVLLGVEGLRWAALAWAALLLLLVAAGLVGVLAAPALAVAAVAVARAGTHTRRSRSLMLASVVLGAASFAYVWWVLAVTIDADDYGTPVPPLAAFGGVGLIGTLVGIVGFVASAVLAVGHDRR